MAAAAGAGAQPTELDSLVPRRRVWILEVNVRFELTVVAVDTTATFAPELWRSRR